MHGRKRRSPAVIKPSPFHKGASSELGGFRATEAAEAEEETIKQAQSKTDQDEDGKKEDWMKPFNKGRNGKSRMGRENKRNEYGV